VVALTKAQLRDAPAYTKEQLADIGDFDERYREPVCDYYRTYGVAAYW
jgi:hypothetical protein